MRVPLRRTVVVDAEELARIRQLSHWSSATFEEMAVVGVHQDKMTSVAWSRDGTRLLTASSDGTARVWPAAPDFYRLEAEARARVFLGSHPLAVAQFAP